ncbi:MAG: tRNA (adenosine(37)-N6)-threonylcarbamoyltransferase complex dimerization subunit type 1 TsaB [Reyranella sp.]|nr:tRNA (adenosine(37)-N6)-threonylcarbamoyltransferase complex dimerization subunit type 1 TsaB [Reyranella sp.]MDP3162553.1 tRNA (adenosine(37)-N6)-threonylcarbamoyltransferase complex dimerization subunit type 1 TsaB [Reyranella sp.]
MTLVLGLDCAISGLGVAVVRDGACLASLREEGRDQAARLLPVVASVLRDSGQNRSELSLIAVTVGPGSFTGVRVGLAAARGLAVGLGVPLAGLVTTSVLKTQAATRDRLVIAAIDSRLGDWFCAIGEEAAPFAVTASGLAERLRGRASVIVGPDIGPLVAQLAAAGVDAMAEVAAVDPVAVARLGLAVGIDAWRARNESEGLPRPLYLRGVSVTLPDGARRIVD